MTFKKSLMLAGGSLFILLLSACGSSSTNTDASTTDLPITLTDAASDRTFAFTAAGDQVVFVFDVSAQSDILEANGITDISTIERVEVRGSFNSWSSSEDFYLTASSTDEGIWFLSVDADEINIPGNSGQPEYKFVVTVGETSSWFNVSENTPVGYQFSGNHILVFSGDNIETIIANDAQAKNEKSLSDFDLTTIEGQQEISNFRQVPELSNLFRSYHPFKQSRDMEAEATRIEYVNSFMVTNNIGSVITLSGEEAAVAPEFITDYMQAIMDAGDNLLLDISYKLVYFSSDGDEFSAAVKSTVEFINDDSHPAPFLIHCRLGTDRTGVLTAVLAGLSGVSWDKIAADYQLSNRLGISEFRDQGLLRYSLRHMLNVDPADEGVDLQQALVNYFINNATLTQSQIDKMVAKIN
ncbi:tyrosine-protein phosphatase [Psychromonas antarctica]|uniref:tyrosine-protein phosphatase n=1 Tax=Psychromonas antarctica TaxID=67573 RepID=UPI001EE9506B|nr:tyrosine-protein phosphatase [Psychromonas antarctica]MCG6202894.1 tyrosine-protein phosphatase [Psychromonas antarctica]